MKRRNLMKPYNYGMDEEAQIVADQVLRTRKRVRGIATMWVKHITTLGRLNSRGSDLLNEISNMVFREAVESGTAYIDRKIDACMTAIRDKVMRCPLNDGNQAIKGVYARIKEGGSVHTYAGPKLTDKEQLSTERACVACKVGLAKEYKCRATEYLKSKGVNLEQGQK